MPENRLLQLLSSADAQFPAPTPVELEAGERLQEPAALVLYTYFPLTCVVSLVSTMENGTSAEVSIVGREGLVGLAAILGTATSPTTARVQVPGTAMRLATTEVRAARNGNALVRRILDLYTEARLVQVAQVAACNRLHPIEARLARWLLGMYGRIEGDALTIPQETISEMLGVHRPTVSVALQHFFATGALRRRGRALILVDRAALERAACECYRLIERETERLFAESPVDVESLLTSLAPAPGDARTSAALEATREIAGRLLLTSIREQEAREVAEAANRVKDRFLAMVSHELRTPLNAILGWCAILDDHPEQTERGLRVIGNNARAQLKVVEDLLDAARMTSSTLTIDPRQISLGQLLFDVVETVRPMAAEKHVELTTDFQQEMPDVVADAHRIRQVLLNVIGNSLKFTVAGGAIHLSAKTDSERVHVTVEDTGRGIPADVLPHVFEQFQRGASGEPGGSGLGLGLAIARAVVELHGGTIEIDSRGENQGTTCRIRLPRSGMAALNPTPV